MTLNFINNFINANFKTISHTSTELTRIKKGEIVDSLKPYSLCLYTFANIRYRIILAGTKDKLYIFRDLHTINIEPNLGYWVPLDTFLKLL